MTSLPHLGSAFIDQLRAIGDRALPFSGNVSADDKDDGSPVTEIDRSTERAIRAVLESHEPGVAIVGEEYGGEPQGSYWLIDPIDGTRAFIRGLDSWSLLLAYVENNKVTRAFAYLPARDECYVGEEGQGAHLISGGQSRRLEVSRTKSLKESYISFGGLEQFQKIPKVLPHLVTQAYSLRSFGDFLSYGLLLQGKVDIAIDPRIQSYDIASATLLVKEAGGQTSDSQGVHSLSPDMFVATNGILHSEVLDHLSRTCGEN